MVDFSQYFNMLQSIFIYSLYMYIIVTSSLFKTNDVSQHLLEYIFNLLSLDFVRHVKLRGFQWIIQQKNHYSAWNFSARGRLSNNNGQRGLNDRIKTIYNICRTLTIEWGSLTLNLNLNPTKIEWICRQEDDTNV